MNTFENGSQAIVHLDRLVHNYTCLQEHLPAHVKIMPVIKANAYGHGDYPAAKALADAGAERFAVSGLPEALSLRRQGINCPILVFVPAPPECAEEISRGNLVQTVSSPQYAQQLREAAQKAGVRLKVHIKVDTGMSRLGFSPDRAEEIAQICSWPEFEPEGIYTHFSCADEGTEDSIAFTKGQYAKFTGLVEQLEAKGIRFALRHCCNSAGSICHPEFALDMARPGIMLYGESPGPGCDGILPLKPVMEWVAPLTMVKEVSPGTAIGYGRTFTAPSPMRIATLSVGYADGYGREQGSVGGWVLVRGQRAPVVGRVCMDQIMLDVTAIPQAQAGDMVTLAGGEGPSFGEMAGRAGTISYEKLCAVGRRVPRVYWMNGRQVASHCDI